MKFEAEYCAETGVFYTVHARVFVDPATGYPIFEDVQLAHQGRAQSPECVLNPGEMSRFNDLLDFAWANR